MPLSDTSATATPLAMSMRMRSLGSVVPFTVFCWMARYSAGGPAPASPQLAPAPPVPAVEQPAPAVPAPPLPAAEPAKPAGPAPPVPAALAPREPSPPAPDAPAAPVTPAATEPAAPVVLVPAEPPTPYPASPPASPDVPASPDRPRPASLQPEALAIPEPPLPPATSNPSCARSGSSAPSRASSTRGPAASTAGHRSRSAARGDEENATRQPPRLTTRRQRHLLQNARTDGSDREIAAARQLSQGARDTSTRVASNTLSVAYGDVPGVVELDETTEGRVFFASSFNVCDPGRSGPWKLLTPSSQITASIPGR